jgi:hypothetical protein
MPAEDIDAEDGEVRETVSGAFKFHGLQRARVCAC